MNDVAENLLSRGIFFLTCIRSSETVPPRSNAWRHGYSGLGYRPPHYKPDMRDYNAYVSIRSSFFRSRRGRAALLYGGIIGRLARSEVSNEEVLRGPSDDALLEGICLWDGKSPFAYWDDYLTEEEIDLICGVYHVSTGDEQVSMVSWWPKPAAFSASGLNIGWWTTMWEIWYQRRLQILETNSGGLFTHTQWKHNLKLERLAPPYTTRLEQTAEHILRVLRP
ncbi:hypothetical protein B0H19DRAFT_931432 [Mycena capillaripes]|nr:hypothetical protein B0H19DRAFT_971669 [Mycena capillaripes]KAJ6578341.1 hypothetical protein B0H19DRAFT_931432 [Mycena capillaripes]